MIRPEASNGINIAHFIQLWQTVDGSLLGVLRGHRRGLWSVKFSPVDQCVLTASGDATIKLWTINDFSCIKTFESHTNSVLKAIFLTRGMQIASSGSDGLVKLWTIKTNECVATLDEHTEKIWSLAATSDGQVLMSGGADSLICQWKNTTEEVESQKAAELEVRLLQEQELSNLLHQKDYVKAVGVAISLEQPNRVLSLLQDLLEKCGLNDDFVDTIQRLRDDQICSVLKYVNSWNQNARHSHVAQSVLTVVLRKYTHEELVKMEGTRSLLEGLIPYTERHLRRVTRLQQLSKFVEYTLQCMKLPSLPTPHDVSDNQVAMETDPVSVISADSTTNFQDEDVGCHDNFDDPENHVTSTTDYSSKTKIMSKRFIRKKQLKEHLRRKSALSIKRSISKINRSTRKTKLKRLS